MLCLTEFHKNYAKDMQRVPDEKIALVPNGIDCEMISSYKDVEKVPGKIVFPSSPDRELDRAIEIVKRARVKRPDLTLHVFYGTQNMRKMGLTEWADHLDGLMRENSDFVIFHGFVPKKELLKHFAEAEAWVYPASFVETHCITALETLLSRCFPIVRNMGALKYTLSEAVKKDMCIMMDLEPIDNESLDYWANQLLDAIESKRWQQIDINPEDYSWEKMADNLVRALDM
jgi:glycosyltransferase involved in cell wall biosynthesis